MADDPREEHELLEAARAGDRAALSTLIARVEPHVYRFGMKMCRDPEEAKDVLQETLLAAVRTLPGYRGDASLSTWLYTIARSFCLKKRRRRKGSEGEHVPLEGPHTEIADERRGPDEALEGRRLEHAIGQAIDALPRMYREVLLLRDVEGLTAPEVAQVLGLGVPAVKTRLHRARLAVREQLAPVLAAQGPGPGCPDVLSLFSRHLEGDIAPDVCARMEQHLASCPRCSGACDSLKRTLSVCRRLAAGPVPEHVAHDVRRAISVFLSSTSDLPPPA